MSKRKKQPQAEQLPSGRWRCRVYDGTIKKQRAFIADTPEEAVMLANEWRLNRDVEQAAPASLEKCIAEYIKIKSNILSPSTIDGYHRIVKRISPELLRKPANRITTADLQREVNRLAGIYSPKTVQTSFGLLSSVLHQAVPKLSTDVSKPAPQKRIRQLPTAAEVIRVFKGDDLELPVLLAMWLSLRVSEVRGLKKSDFTGGKVTINRVIVTIRDGGTHKDIEKQAAKTTDSRRVIDVPPEIQHLVDAVSGDYITTLSGQAIYKRFIRRMSAAGFQGVTFHDLRHVNASVMLLLGIPDKYAMERGGWSTPDVLRRVYQETYNAERENVTDRINGYFGDIYGKISHEN